MTRSGKPTGQRKPACGQIKRQVKNRMRQCCAGDFKTRFQSRWLHAGIQIAAPFHLPAGEHSTKAIKPELTIFQRQRGFGVFHWRQAQNGNARSAQGEAAIKTCQGSKRQRFLICQIRRGQGQVFCRQLQGQLGACAIHLQPRLTGGACFGGDHAEKGQRDDAPFHCHACNEGSRALTHPARFVAAQNLAVKPCRAGVAEGHAALRLCLRQIEHRIGIKPRIFQQGFGNKAERLSAAIAAQAQRGRQRGEPRRQGQRFQQHRRQGVCHGGGNLKRGIGKAWRGAKRNSARGGDIGAALARRKPLHGKLACFKRCIQRNAIQRLALPFQPACGYAQIGIKALQRFIRGLPAQGFRKQAIQSQRINRKPKPECGPRAKAERTGAGKALAIQQQRKFRRLNKAGFQHHAPTPFKAAQSCRVRRCDRKAESRETIAEAGAGDAECQFQPFAKCGAARFQLSLSGQKRCDIRQRHARTFTRDARLEAA